VEIHKPRDGGLTIGLDQEKMSTAERKMVKNRIQSGAKLEAFLLLSSPDDVDLPGSSARDGQPRFFPINAKNRRVRSLPLLFGCLDLGGYEIVR
jgi:hypothetical protein